MQEEVQEMRGLMFDAADVDHVKQLHEFGRQLMVLKVIYETYPLIVSRFLNSCRMVRGANMTLVSPQNTLHDRDFLLVIPPFPDWACSKIYLSTTVQNRM